MKKILFTVLTLTVLTSCVTKKQFTELSDKYDRLRDTSSDLVTQNDELIKDKFGMSKELRDLKQEQLYYNNQSKKLNDEIDAIMGRYNKLQESYDDLSTNSSSTINSKINENQTLLSELETKENKLLQEEAKLTKLKAALDSRSQRITDLEALIASKEAAMQKLKSAISEALVSFEGKGLTVENRDGKIYVSMENKLLFQSGRWDVGVNGKPAVVELAKVLEKNPTINVLIEGHTDNDPYHGGVIKDNWDLSVKRATAIVRILQDQNVSPKQITAAGRSEYIPVAANTTDAGKAKNRRIEIVLSPNLDEVTKLLNE
ncbi:chemotaxis protein MotB [Wenyingzhuangia heitensis]|uniref:Chemotaxis protein MotB n=1 Tax=Wenyingzhuangia heitensis TaxID=1487859 RepID=A0ABX0U8T3_9FLAO|nr:OmpA family protein [Wenyingzhuangia heitensis]NIJ44016.1 chemotaxis protein MotB [Wenyingzhuangia heitensis]